MNETANISQLKNTDYSIKPRVQERYIGQKAAFRYFSAADRADMTRLKTIMDDSKVQEWMAEAQGLSDRDLVIWAKERGLSRNKNSFLFAVSGSPVKVQPTEVGEVQGFVYLYCGAEERARMKRMREANLLDKGEKLGFELSYAAHPQAEHGQIASVLRQICLTINKLRGNVSNLNMLAPNMPIFAFVDPKNTASVNVLRAAGFVNKGHMRYDEDSETDDDVYVMDWELLNRRIHENADQALFGSVK